MRSLRSAFVSLGLAFATLALCATRALGAPYRGDILTLQQPDRSLIQVRVHGDEFYHRIESLDGYTLTQDPKTRWIEYARFNSAGTDFVSTGVRYRGGARGQTAVSTAPAGLPKGLDLDRDLRIGKAKANRLLLDKGKPPRAGRAALPGPGGQGSGAATLAAPAPTVGAVKGITLLIDFADDVATVPQTKIADYLNQVGYAEDGMNGSVRDYFRAVSGNALDYTNHVTAYYRAKHPKTHYTDPEIGYSQRARELIREALMALDAQGFDFSTLSVDENGNIRAINMFYAGYIQNAWAQGLWPHMSGMHGEFTADGVNAGVYQITNIGDYPSLGTFCHENGHMLMGWGDLYDYDGNSIGVGNYCLMAYQGPWNNPVPPNAYFRHNAGWDQVTDIPAGSQGTFIHTANSNTSFRFTNPAKEGEWFFIESRVKTGRNDGLPDEGLLIWHVDQFGSNSWEQMTPEQHYHVSVEQADGRFDLERNLSWEGDGDLFHAGYRTEFADWTLPDSRWWSGAPSGLNVMDIGPIGPTMTFAVSPGKYRGIDIGNPGQRGTAVEAGGTLTLEGGGADIWGASDQFHFHYTTLRNDGYVVARVASLENTDPWAKAGVMVRAASDANSVHAFMGVTAANGLAFQRRTATGGQSEHTGAAGAAPRWVRLERKRTSILASHSVDGVSWTMAEQVTLPLGEAALAGFAVTSHNNATLATAVFTDYQVFQSPWTPLDVGTVGIPGDYSLAGGTITIQGGGADIWGNQDSFFWLSQPFSAEGRIVARVNSLGNTDPWAKAGVMFREGPNPDAGNAMMAITAANGATFQRREMMGQTSVDNTQAGVVAPRWIRLDHRFGVLRGYHSADGKAWTEVGSGASSASFGINYVGLAVTSHNNAVRTTAVFDSIEIQRGWASLDLSDPVWADPAGNGDGLPNPGEEMILTVRVRNSGTVPAKGVTAVLNLDDPYVTGVTTQAAFGDVPAGGFSETREFRYRIAANAPSNHSFTIPFEVKDAYGEIWNAAFFQAISTTLSISGRVTIGDGLPAQVAYVTCFNADQHLFQNTDLEGRYRISTAVPGTFSCGAGYSGYPETPRRDITIPPSVQGVDFVLRRPDIAVNRTSVSDTLDAGQSRHHPVVLSNPGDLPLEFSVVNPQGGYAWKDSDAPGGPAYAWTDIRATGTRLDFTGGMSARVAVQNLSFAFPYYGIDYRTVYVTPVGYLTLLDDYYQAFTLAVPNAAAPHPLLAPFWGEIDATSGAAYFQEFADRAVVQYDNVPATRAGGAFTFQVVLFRDGRIQYLYNTMTNPSVGMVGLQNHAGDKGFTLVYHGAYVRNGLAVEFRPLARDWLSASPATGTVAPGGSATVNLVLDAAPLAAGTHQGRLTVNHNAFHAGAAPIEVSLLVRAAPTGGLRREVWNGIAGTAISALTSNAGYPRNPTTVSSISAFESPRDVGDNYGQRLRGFLTPPATGDYSFWIAGDDNCELRLSTDDHPGRAALIARVPGWTGPREWAKYPEQRSVPIRLEAGKKYYIEAHHKEGGGGDHVSVGWQGPGITGEAERPIPGSRLAPFDPAALAGLDIGNPGRAGSHSFSGGVHTVIASGADIWGAADQFRYVYQPLVGDGEITALVTGVQNTDGWAKAGVMIRESLAADARHAYTAVTAANGLAFQRRTATAGQSIHTGVSGSAPRWVRLRRAGNVFTSFVSMDGAAWIQVGSETIAMGAATWVGLAVTSHNNAQLSTCTLESLTIR